MKRIMNWLWASLGLLILTALVLPGQRHGTASASTAVSNGKYQLVTAIVNEPAKGGGTAEFHEFFLVDEASGHVWAYGPGLSFESNGEKRHLESYFFEVKVDGLNGAQVLNEQFEELKHLNSPSNAQPSTQPPK